MVDVNGFILTAILSFLIIGFLFLLKEIVCSVLEKLYDAVVNVLGSIFGRDRVESFFNYTILISLICCATLYFWHCIIKPIYDCIDF